MLSVMIGWRLLDMDLAQTRRLDWDPNLNFGLGPISNFIISVEINYGLNWNF